MGNHTAGMAMGRLATAMLRTRVAQPALSMLDEICERYRGCDAEFEVENSAKPGTVQPEYDSYTNPAGPLGILIAEAFGVPGRDYKTGFPHDAAAVDAWWDGPYGEFDKRYEFC